MAMVGCGGKVPGPGVPGAGGLGGASGDVDPNTCGNYAASDAGAKLKAFLQATKDLQTTTSETVKVIKQSCITMGNELGMTPDALGGDDTGKICSAVFQTYNDNLKASIKPNAKLTIHYTPAHCEVQASASASAGAACSGAAAAGPGGASGEGQCQAAAQVNAAVHAECTPAKLDIEADAKIVVDKAKADMTLKAARDSLPALLNVAARVKPLQDAFGTWMTTAKALADVAPKVAESFGDQALCVSGQLAAAARAAANIQVNVEVSVSVSASATGSVGG